MMKVGSKELKGREKIHLILEARRKKFGNKIRKDQ